MARTAHDWFDLAMEQRVEKDSAHLAVSPLCLRLVLGSVLHLFARIPHWPQQLLYTSTLLQPMRLGEDRPFLMFFIRQDHVCSVS